MARAKKSLGQHFLVDPNIQRKIVEAIDSRPEDELLEIGPGQGALTHHLVGRVARLTAVELDRELAEQLRQRYQHRPDVRIIQGDILELPLSRISEHTDGLIVVGNIPYNITTPIVFHLLERQWRPARIVLMIQKEVADRMTAAPGDEAYGALSIGVQSVSRTERLFPVSRNSFRPVPNVDSTVIRLTPFRPFPLSAQEEADLRALTQAAFAWRRKQLQRTLRDAPAYRLHPEQVASLQKRTGIPLDRRPETLSPTELLRLANALRGEGLPRRPS